MQSGQISNFIGYSQSASADYTINGTTTSTTATLSNASYNQQASALNNSGSITYGPNSLSSNGYWNIPAGQASGVTSIASGTTTITLNNNYYNNYTTYVGTGVGTSYQYKKQMIFDNTELTIDEDGKVYIDGKIEMNPTKVGAALLKALQAYRKDPVEDVKDFFEKD